MVTGVELETDEVAMVKFGDVVLPAGTVTLAATWATRVSELASETMAPPAPATPFNVTWFAVVELPPTREAGDNASEDTESGITVRVAVVEVEP
jgi:hypothetical protein